MKKLVFVLSISLVVSSCAIFCTKFTPESMARVSETMHKIQTNYDGLIVMLGKDPSPKVKLAVVAADMALATLGSMRETWCADQDALLNAQMAAKQVEKVVNE